MRNLDLFTLGSFNQGRLIRRSDLEPINNLKAVFRQIRDYLAGNVTGITRDETIAQQLMYLLLCKVYDETHTDPDGVVRFALRPQEDDASLQSRISSLLNHVIETFGPIFGDNEVLKLEGYGLRYVVAQLEPFSLSDADRDVIADAFEELIGTAFRGGEGQFFTPRNVVEMMIDVLNPSSGQRVIDPACGSGGFLSHIARHLIQKGATDCTIVGIDKDLFLARLAKIYLSIIGGPISEVVCENSLERPETWLESSQKTIKLNSFDIVLTNPPFGAKIPVVGSELLKQYALGHDWVETQGQWKKSNTLREKQPPQILFIERCLQLLRKGGRMGIVLPEGIFGNPSERYIWDYIKSTSIVLGVVSLSQETFQPSTHTKTSILFLEKTSKCSKPIFMSIADSVGHDKNGKETYKTGADGSILFDAMGKRILDDDLPVIARNFKTHLNGGLKAYSRLGFEVEPTDTESNIFIPEYYNPDVVLKLKALKSSGKYELKTIGQLLNEGFLEIRRGNEIGSRNYGTGSIPFVRTTDIVNWEIKHDPVKGVSEDVYEKYRKNQDIREGDILFVNDGTFLIGRTAMVTRLDAKLVIQSHLKKFRILRSDSISPFYFFFLLNTDIVRKQMESKIFVQATISTIGNRLLEIQLPILKDKRDIAPIEKEMAEIINEKCKLRERRRRLMENSI
jgi:type I restriction enzyme M protein